MPSSPEAEKVGPWLVGISRCWQSGKFGLCKLMARKRLDTDSLPAIARRLRALRHWLGFSQQEMAEQLSLPKNTWAGYEGTRSRIPVDAALDLYRRWRIDPKWVYMGIEADMTIETMKELNAQLAIDDERERGRSAGIVNGNAA